MSDKTGISWTDATWNPVRGCSRVSAGCVNCYAEVQAARIVRMGKGKPTAYDGLAKLVSRDVRQIKIVGGEATGDFRTVKRTEARWTGVVRLVPEQLAWPLRKRKPLRIFVNSMSDLFHESLTNEQIAAVFGVMAACPQHTFQVLTKRAKRMREWFEWAQTHRAVVEGWSDCDYRIAIREDLDASAGRVLSDDDCKSFLRARNVNDDRWPLPNVWLGVSVENQAAADERIPELLSTPAAVRFLSCEPLLGAVRLDDGSRSGSGDWLRTFRRGDMTAAGAEIAIDRARIDWVIAGCESGAGARPCDVAWLRSLRDQCNEAGVAFFLKQAVASRFTVIGGEEHRRGPVHEVAFADDSKRKPGGVIELPYLDGVQHAAFPGGAR